MQILRIPREDLQALSETWATWLAGGIVPEPSPDAAYDQAMDTWWRDPDHSSRNRPRRSPGEAALESYEHHRLFISEKALNRWLGNVKPRTGAPGRPSSMFMVLAEFERRRTAEKCEASRTAEAKALAIWLKAEHPDEPPLTPKSILNKLPGDFQPHNGSRNKNIGSE